ncbi:MAG TPA: hypothetical protein VFS66_01845 [Acidimicrobiia bacterium]|nr:hypothetical protein [Acidimicrobiia bacterium]
MAWLILIGLVAAVCIAALWLYRWWDRVDSYYEREYEDPPATDITSGFGGGRS